MSRKELRRIHMLRQVMAQKLAQVKAGALVRLTAEGIDHFRRRKCLHRAWRERRPHV